jgi:hypothetical protein
MIVVETFLLCDRCGEPFGVDTATIARSISKETRGLGSLAVAGAGKGDDVGGGAGVEAGA